MSIKIMSLVWELDLPDSEKIVLLALADCANDEGYCWPGMNTLSRKCTKSQRTVQYALRSLEAAKHISRREVIGRGCEYMIHPRSNCTPAETAPPQSLRRTPATVAPKPSRTVKPCVNRAQWHRLPEGWRPEKPYPPQLQAKLDQWPPGMLEDKIACFKRWAANAPDQNGKGRKLDWDKALWNWLTREHDERRTNSMGRHQSSGDGLSSTARAAVAVFGAPGARQQ